VAAEADCVPLLAAADGVIQTIELLEDGTESTAWTQTTAAAPGIPGPRRYTLSHPAGWAVREAIDRVELDGTLGDPSPGGAVHIEAVPRQPKAYYDAAQALLGAPPGLRWVGSQVTGGRRTSEYAVNDLEPTRWLVTGPDLPEGSPEGRALDQAVWRILLNSSFTYAEAPGYP
jgi:hypothetical protein